MTLRIDDNDDVNLLTVAIDLHSESGQAICWSMQPDRVEKPTKVKLGSELFAEFKIGLVAIGASAKEEDEMVVYEPEITAFGLGQRDPSWEFQPVEGRQLRGVQLLHLVVQQPRETTSTAAVHVSLEADRKGLIQRFLGRVETHRADITTLVLPPARAAARHR